MVRLAGHGRLAAKSRELTAPGCVGRQPSRSGVAPSGYPPPDERGVTARGNASLSMRGTVGPARGRLPCGRRTAVLEVWWAASSR
jgi:hypothetical protein